MASNNNMSITKALFITVAFLLAGVQAIHAFIPANWYDLIVAVLLGAETFFGTTGAMVAGIFKKS